MRERVEENVLFQYFLAITEEDRPYVHGELARREGHTDCYSVAEVLVIHESKTVELYCPDCGWVGARQTEDRFEVQVRQVLGLGAG